MKSWILGMALLLAAPKGGKPADTLQKANALVSAMKYAEAEALVRGAMKKNPKAHGYHLALGRVLLASGKPADAYLEFMYEGLRAGTDPAGEEAFKAADSVLEQKRGPEVEDAKLVAQAIEKTGGEPLEAKKLLESVSNERKKHFVVRLYMAEAKMRAFDAAPALKEFRALSAEDPHFVPSVVLEAMSLRWLGKQKEAEAVAAKARKMAPKHGALAALKLLAEPLPSPLPTPLQPPPTPSPGLVPAP